VNLLETIRDALDRHGLIPDGANVVAGVSGGADSVALLHALHALGINCTVAHLNHQLRGEESETDETFVRNLAADLGYECITRSVDVAQLAADSGDSIEMAARRARHEFFAEFNNAVIALAHHADDQVETFFLKLARGAGTDGLCGMSYLQAIGPIRLIRPMLDIPRTAILEWLKENHFEWREDASNSDENFRRNKVRHSIIPLLEQELNPGIRDAVLRTMDILREEKNIVDEASSFVASAGTKLEASSTLQLPLALQRRVVRTWLFENDTDEAGFETVDSILKLMECVEGTKTYELNGSQRIVIEYGLLRVEASDEKEDAGWKLMMKRGTGWREDPGNAIGVLPAEASFDAAKIGSSPITVRHWLEGDRMAPLGMEGSRKLQDIFTDQKIPRAQRNSIPVVVCRDEIIWLPGYRIARGWEVQGDDGEAVHVRVERIGTE
jgi:tRNA(Ile)-lysidine synthase